MSNLIEQLNWRYATKKFDPSKILSSEDLDQLLEAARLAPSSFGLQPWKIIVVKNVELRQKIQAVAWNQSQVTEASDLIVFCAKNEFSDELIVEYITETARQTGVEVKDLAGFQKMLSEFKQSQTPESGKAWMERQVYIALGFVLFAAAQLRVDACPMEGFDPAQVGKILKIDEQGLHAIAICPVGYRSTEDTHADESKVRYAKTEVVEVIA